MYLDLNKDLTPEQIALRADAPVCEGGAASGQHQAGQDGPRSGDRAGSALWEIPDVLPAGISPGAVPGGAWRSEPGSARHAHRDRRDVGRRLRLRRRPGGRVVSVRLRGMVCRADRGNKRLLEEIVLPFAADRGAKPSAAGRSPNRSTATLMLGTEAFTNLAAGGAARLDGDEWVSTDEEESSWIISGTIATRAVVLTIDPSMGMAGGGGEPCPLDRRSHERKAAGQTRPARAQPGEDLLRRRAHPARLHARGSGRLPRPS